MSDFRIGNKEFHTPVMLAPMAGTSSVAFRIICHEFGSAYQPTELVSARSIVYSGFDKSFRYMLFDKEKEGLGCIQFFGSDPADFEYAINKVCENEQLKDVSIIDINMGCPVPKVVKTGAGSALMKTPELAGQIVKTARKVCEANGKSLTVKTRVGFTDEDKALGKGIEFAKVLADNGAELIAVHGRTATQMYHGDADIDAIAKMREAVANYGVPFIANGDIVDGPSAIRMLSTTKADGLMIGRAAQGNPWVFDEVKKAIEIYEQTGEVVDTASVITFEERKAMLLRELKDTCKYKEEDFAVREMRPSMMAYIKGMPGAAKLKVDLCAALTVKEVEEILWRQ